MFLSSKSLFIGSNYPQTKSIQCYKNIFTAPSQWFCFQECTKCFCDDLVLCMLLFIINMTGLRGDPSNILAITKSVLPDWCVLFIYTFVRYTWFLVLWSCLNAFLVFGLILQQMPSRCFAVSSRVFRVQGSTHCLCLRASWCRDWSWWAVNNI